MLLTIPENCTEGQEGRPMKLLLEIIGIIVAGAVLGLVAAYFRLLDNIWAVIILGMVISALIVYGMYLGKKIWEEDDWPG